MVVTCAVRVHQTVNVLVRQVDRRLAALERQLELPGRHAVAQPEDGSLADVALQLVSLADRAAIELGGELGVDVPPLPELLDQISLPGDVGHHAGLDLAAVAADDLVPSRCPKGVTQRATPGQVLEVHLVAAGEAPGVRPVVVEHDGQPPAVGDREQPCGARLLQSGLEPEAGGHQSLHHRVGVFLQGGELEVGLGEGIRLLARGPADLHRRLDTPLAQQLGELVVRHDELFALAAKGVHQLLLADLHRHEVGRQLVHVQLDRGLGVHADGGVDHPHLGDGEPLAQLLEQGVGQVDVVRTVAHVCCKLCGSEVPAPLAYGEHHLLPLLAQLVLLGQCLEAAADRGLMQGARHRQGVQPELGVDAELPRQDGPVEHGVVAEDGLVGVVERLEELAHIVATVGIDRSVVDLDAHTDHLEA